MAAFLYMHLSTILSYSSFVFGQFCFLLKRANSAKQNKTTVINTVWQFFCYSAIPIFVRGVLEIGFFALLIKYPAIIGYIIGWWGWHLPSGVSSALNRPIFFVFWLFAGYAADSMLDAASVYPKIPQPIRNWIKENVPTNEFYRAGATSPPQSS